MELPVRWMLLLLTSLAIGVFVLFQSQGTSAAGVDEFELAGVVGVISGETYPGVWILRKDGQVRYCQVASKGMSKPTCTEYSN
ncbi:hypothetical protein [Mesorhizobium neociceri]|uniref:Uncharacterized protein n=1 Tax=Mesorhizobium neociceri TaxID=1307853 RepID=A0A838AY43_9HYPH|nr:hypothetical protein [Mesorhizobium neociceri]MBA1138995.1 hypothetical protein [Mesorhizobium neociceri]